MKDFTEVQARNIVKSVERVLNNQNIEALAKQAYEFITLHMGFIAHYDCGGFQSVYADLRLFVEKLQTSEYSDDRQHNLRWADKQETDSDFQKWYGAERQKLVAWTIRGIINLAVTYEEQIVSAFNLKQSQQELAVAEKLAGKNGYKLVAV